jgi:hypothetical protein
MHGWKEAIRRSRIDTTRRLGRDLGCKEAAPGAVTASGIDYAGDAGTSWSTTSPPGARVSRAGLRRLGAAAAAGRRFATSRFG